MRSFSDRVVVTSEGRIEQVGTPFEVYNFPQTSFVASFVGSLNVMRGTVVDARKGRIAIDGQEIVASKSIENLKTGDPASIALRPEIISLDGLKGDGNHMRGLIEDVNFLGSIVRIRVRFRDNSIYFDQFNNPRLAPPQRRHPVTICFPMEAVLVMDPGAQVPELANPH